MRLSCPACGSTISLDAALAHEGARDAVMIALQLPAPLGKLLIQYVALFRPARRALSLDRLASLLGELLPLIEAAQIERNGRAWPAPQDTWRAALEQMIAGRDKLTLPLKSHGYLLEIIAGIAGKSEAVAEQKREEQRAYPYREERRTSSPQTVKAALEQIRAIAGRSQHDDKTS
jgi:hypothetical protein